MSDAIITKLIINHVEIGEYIYYEVNWRDKLILLTRCKNQFLHARVKLRNDQPLQKVWMNVLEMLGLLLRTIYLIRCGDWKLLLQCITRILPYTFAFGHINYVCYLSLIFGDMFQLTNDSPDVYEEFVGGKFAPQVTENSKILRIKRDKVIEMTLNKDTKVITF